MNNGPWFYKYRSMQPQDNKLAGVNSSIIIWYVGGLIHSASALSEKLEVFCQFSVTKFV